MHSVQRTHRELGEHDLPQQRGDAVEDADVDAVGDDQQHEAVVPEEAHDAGAVALRCGLLQCRLSGRGR